MIKYKLAIIGLGYVGLPLLLASARNFKVVGYDLNKIRINQLKNFIDINNEFDSNSIKKKVSNITFTNQISDIKNCNIYIITVPTPIYKNKVPNLSFIKQASILVSKVLSKKNYVIYESTVYPGLIEEYCVPIIAKISRLTYNKTFFCGYSPERVNPSDRVHKLINISKIVSASNKSALKYVSSLYKRIIKAKVYSVDSIKIAEASKVIENAQRDVNIAFMNEITMIFNKMNLDTNKIIEAASTKWNFLPFKPGLVGGHCIGVDPYYLYYKALKVGYKPKIINAGRSINDQMPHYIFTKLKQNMKKNKISLIQSNILLMGLTFKENCLDTRNSKVIDLFNLLTKKRCNIEIYDPIINFNSQKKYIQNSIVSYPKNNFYDAIIICVAHNNFKKMNFKKIKSFSKNNSIIFDVKNILEYHDNVIKL